MDEHWSHLCTMCIYSIAVKLPNWLTILLFLSLSLFTQVNAVFRISHWLDDLLSMTHHSQTEEKRTAKASVKAIIEQRDMHLLEIKRVIEIERIQTIYSDFIEIHQRPNYINHTQGTIVMTALNKMIKLFTLSLKIRIILLMQMNICTTTTNNNPP